MVGLAWGIPIGNLPLSFEGFANFIAAKGKNEFGAPTAAETNIDMQIMYDLSGAMGGSKNTFKVGLEYQYWMNKFGNDATGNKGAFAKTPMIRAEYHF
jgi:nucleoside-specific outer membrane channel protein Tsx